MQTRRGEDGVLRSQLWGVRFSLCSPWIRAVLRASKMHVAMANLPVTSTVQPQPQHCHHWGRALGGDIGLWVWVILGWHQHFSAVSIQLWKLQSAEPQGAHTALIPETKRARQLRSLGLHYYSWDHGNAITEITAGRDGVGVDVPTATSTEMKGCPHVLAMSQLTLLALSPPARWDAEGGCHPYPLLGAGITHLPSRVCGTWLFGAESTWLYPRPHGTASGTSHALLSLVLSRCPQSWWQQCAPHGL